MENSSSNFMEKFRAGDTAAFSEMYSRHYRTLCFFATRLVKDVHEAEDIVAESFIKLWRLHKDFESEQNVKAFLFIATRNAAFNFLRSAKVASHSRKEFHYLSDETSSAFYSEITTELMHLVYTDIDQLPPKRRKVLQLYLEGCSEKEIAEKLQINAKTVRNQKATAIQILKLEMRRKAGTVIGKLLLALTTYYFLFK